MGTNLCSSLSSCVSFCEFYKCRLLEWLSRPICIMLSFSLCQGSSAWFVCVLWYTTPFMSPRWIHFWPQDSITHSLIHAHKTHSQQTKSPYSHTAVQKLSCLCFRRATGTSGPKAPALIMLSVSPHPEGYPVIHYQAQSQIIRPQLQELQNGFIMCPMREAMEREWSDLYQWLLLCLQPTQPIREKYTWLHLTGSHRVRDTDWYSGLDGAFPVRRLTCGMVVFLEPCYQLRVAVLRHRVNFNMLTCSQRQW